MTIRPLIPQTGVMGWRFLQRTMGQQMAAFGQGATIQRDTTYFEAHIQHIDTAEQLVSDRRLLRVALGAFGLQDDIDNRYFIRKVLEGGTFTPDALANRLADDRYTRLAKTFGFGDLSVPHSKISDFGQKITGLYRDQQFQRAVGEQDGAMRLALYAQTQLPSLAADKGSDSTKWFRVMGTAPLRQVFEKALGLPHSFGRLDLDQQLGVLREKSERQLGIRSVNDLADPDIRDRLINRFLIRGQVQTSSNLHHGATALSLLQTWRQT